MGGEQVPSSAATYWQLLLGKLRSKFLPPVPNKVSAGLTSPCICLLGQKQGPESNYLLFLGQRWVITVESGGYLAVCGDVISAPRRKRAGLNKL